MQRRKTAKQHFQADSRFMGENTPRQQYQYNFCYVLIQINLTCIKFEWATIDTKPVDYLNFIFGIDLKKLINRHGLE